MHQSLPDKNQLPFAVVIVPSKESLLFHTPKGNSRNNVFGQE